MSGVGAVKAGLNRKSGNQYRAEPLAARNSG
jgi:hypothetical protein